MRNALWCFLLGLKMEQLELLKEDLEKRGFQHWEVAVGGNGVQIISWIDELKAAEFGIQLLILHITSNTYLKMVWAFLQILKINPVLLFVYLSCIFPVAWASKTLQLETVGANHSFLGLGSVMVKWMLNVLAVLLSFIVKEALFNCVVFFYKLLMKYLQYPILALLCIFHSAINTRSCLQI